MIFLTLAGIAASFVGAGILAIRVLRSENKRRGLVPETHTDWRGRERSDAIKRATESLDNPFSGLIRKLRSCN